MASTTSSTLFSSTSNDNLANVKHKPNITVSIHPSVLLTMSDCWIRLKLQLLTTENANKSQSENEAQPLNCSSLEHAFINGVILGVQEGRHVQILNCFLMPQTERPDSSWSAETYHQCVEHFRVVSTNLMVLGAFFCTASGNFNTKMFSQITGDLLPQESSFVLLLESQRRHLEKLPLTVLCPLTAAVPSSSVSDHDPNEHAAYISVDYTIMTDESERLVVDELIQTSSGLPDDRHHKSQISSGLQNESDAIQMMLNRMQTLVAYVAAVRSGELPLIRPLLRQITAICQRLHREREVQRQKQAMGSNLAEYADLSRDAAVSAIINDTDDTGSRLSTQCCDVTLNTLLCLMTEGVSVMHDILHKNIVLQSEQRRTGGIGLMDSTGFSGLSSGTSGVKKRSGAMSSALGHTNTFG